MLLHNFEGYTLEQLADEWSRGYGGGDDLNDDGLAIVEILKNATIHFGAYTYENYSGDAFLLYEVDGVLYEVNGSHCSCYGLEGQWKPEVASLKELINRVETGWSFTGYREELKQALLQIQKNKYAVANKPAYKSNKYKDGE